MTSESNWLDTTDLPNDRRIVCKRMPAVFPVHRMERSHVAGVETGPATGGDGTMMVFMGLGTELSAYYRSRRIQAIINCARSCDMAARQGLDRLQRGDDRAAWLARTVDLLNACREFCSLASHLASHHNSLAPLALEGCDEVCLHCAAMCEQDRDEAFSTCARLCRDASDACRRLVPIDDDHGRADPIDSNVA